MNKAAIVLLAGTDGFESMGRMANALTAVKEFRDAGDDVTLIFDGASCGSENSESLSSGIIGFMGSCGVKFPASVRTAREPSR